MINQMFIFYYISKLSNVHFFLKVTTGVLGSCFLYSLVETLFGRREDDIIDNKHMSESWIIFLLSLPYLIDFFSGCMSFYFTYLIITLEDERRPKRNKVIILIKSSGNSTFQSNQLTEIGHGERRL